MENTRAKNLYTDCHSCISLAGVELYYTYNCTSNREYYCFLISIRLSIAYGYGGFSIHVHIPTMHLVK